MLSMPATSSRCLAVSGGRTHKPGPPVRRRPCPAPRRLGPLHTSGHWCALPGTQPRCHVSRQASRCSQHPGATVSQISPALTSTISSEVIARPTCAPADSIPGAPRISAATADVTLFISVSDVPGAPCTRTRTLRSCRVGKQRAARSEPGDQDRRPEPGRRRPGATKPGLPMAGAARRSHRTADPAIKRDRLVTPAGHPEVAARPARG